MSLILSGTDGLSDVDGSASTPAIRGTDANTGMFFPAADTIAFTEGGTEAMRLTSAGTVAIGTTTTPAAKLWVESGRVGLSNTYKLGWHSNPAAADFSNYITGDDSTNYVAIGTNAAERMRIDSSGNVGIGITPDTKFEVSGTGAVMRVSTNHSTSGTLDLSADATAAQIKVSWYNSAVPLVFKSGNTEQMRIDSSGNLLVGTTTSFPGEGNTTAGMMVSSTGTIWCSRSSYYPLNVNRSTNDGTLVSLRQDGTEEGTISVSGTTVSYNGGHLSRYAQTAVPKDESIVKGTVLSNLDEMNQYFDADGNQVANEQLNKVKVSDVDGDVNVAGVFVNWSHDEAHNVDEINMAMTGDMIIRIAQGVVVQRGDLLMSAGDGTAKPQGDDIVRSKTIAKVTSNHITCTYADGSYCVPCVLMAC